NFRWVTDMGLPGPDAGKGGKHVILPPDWKGEPPAGHHTGKSTTNRVFLIIRSLPIGGDIKAAIERIQTVKIQPLNPPADWKPPTWTNVTEKCPSGGSRPERTWCGNRTASPVLTATALPPGCRNPGSRVSQLRERSTAIFSPATARQRARPRPLAPRSRLG